jgi:mono/diheme cytochrome c family protein
MPGRAQSTLTTLAAITLILTASLQNTRATPPVPKLIPHPSRQSPDDLEITGLASTPAYLTYAQLASLPQVAIHVTNDENFPHPVLVTGIPLDTLAKALRAPSDDDLIDALCTDDYRAHYPATYIALHHPILALTIDHQRPTPWAARTHQYDPGPYFITHAHFVPTLNVLAHKEQPQIPTNIIRLNFSTTQATYGAIAPRGSTAQSPAVQQGFAVAKQNCLRCHNQGPYGGAKAGRDWSALSTWAREQPTFFAAYIHNPQAFEPHAHMPPNPTYDAPTLAALTAYFQTFTAPPTHAR